MTHPADKYARYWAKHGRYIEQAGEARAEQVAAMPRDAIIRLAPEPRPPLLRRLAWPGVLACILGLALLGVKG